VFIIDEVHMLSQQAFNAFLKTLEEPPKYVIFILATTEKHKILPTILSRCQVYDFARITIQNTIDHLKYVAQKEGYNVEEEALSLIARKADGGMRDALSIFDQMVSFTQGNITYQSTLENLNILDSEYYFRLVDHLLNKEVEASLLLFNEVVEKGFDGGNFIAGLASHLRNLLVSRDAKTLPLLEVGETQRQRYHEQALRCRPQFLYRTIRLCNDCDLGYRQSRNKRLQVEICLIQAAQSADDDGDGAGRRPAKILKPLFKQLTAPRAETVATAQRTSADSPAAGGAAAAQRTPSIPEKKIPSVSQPAAKPKDTIAISLNSISIRNIRPASSQPQTAPTTQQPSPAQTSSSAKAGHLDTDNLILFWQQYANSLPQSEVATAQRMRGTTPELISPEEFVVTVNNPLIEKQLLKMQKSIEDYFSRQLNGSRVSMKVRVIEVEIAVRSYNKAEQFQQLLRENPN
ncbi:MAG: DNA polymerase III subunit gamma/tau, partial [Bacteroidaceae bacterium]|nr:DNA polymerase III subunit gamma/tau [Bacteroidaceae bacterium]